MKLLLRLTLLILAALLALPPLAAPHPVAAQTPDPNKYMEPGHYIGFVSIILHSDTFIPVKEIGPGATATVEYEGLWIQRNGLLKLYVYEMQDAWAEINLNPIYTVMEYFDYARTPVGDCTLGASWHGEMRHVSEKTGLFRSSKDAFFVPIPFQDIRSLTFDFYEASGSLPGCDKRLPGDTIWHSLVTASESESKKITEIVLWVETRPRPWTMNGICTVRGWDKSGELPGGGTYTQDTPLCKWNAFQPGPTHQSWTKVIHRKMTGTK